MNYVVGIFILIIVTSNAMRHSDNQRPLLLEWKQKKAEEVDAVIYTYGPQKNVINGFPQSDFWKRLQSFWEAYDKQYQACLDDIERINRAVHKECERLVEDRIKRKQENELKLQRLKEDLEQIQVIEVQPPHEQAKKISPIMPLPPPQLPVANNGHSDLKNTQTIMQQVGAYKREIFSVVCVIAAWYIAVKMTPWVKGKIQNMCRGLKTKENEQREKNEAIERAAVNVCN